MEKILITIIVSIVLLAIGPMLTIWSVNTLFPVLEIPYTLETWSAVILLGLFLRARVEKT
jgi:hypothetical protein